MVRIPGCWNLSPIQDMMGASFSFFTAEAVKATDWSVAKPLLDQLMWHCASLAAFAKLRWFGEHCEASGSPPLPLRWQLYLDKKTKFGPERKLREGWAPECSGCWFSRFSRVCSCVAWQVSCCQRMVCRCSQMRWGSSFLEGYGELDELDQRRPFSIPVRPVRPVPGTVWLPTSSNKMRNRFQGLLQSQT